LRNPMIFPLSVALRPARVEIPLGGTLLGGSEVVAATMRVLTTRLLKFSVVKRIIAMPSLSSRDESDYQFHCISSGAVIQE